MPGTEVVMHKEGDRLILQPAQDGAAAMLALLDEWRNRGPLPPEEWMPEIDDPPPEPVDL